MAKKQRYMNERDRVKLEAYLNAGKKVAWIAKELGFCRQSIYNEMHRGAYTCIKTVNGIQREVVRYSSVIGQKVHDYNQTAKGRPLKIGSDRAYADFLEAKMLGIQDDGKRDHRKRYSPAAALAEARKAGFVLHLSVGTIYNYIDKGVFLRLTNKDLWVKGQKKRRKGKTKRNAHPLLPSIEDRPEIINQRDELGHKEGDLIVGKTRTKAAVLTLTDRKSREEWAFKIPDKTAASVRTVFNRLERKLGKRRFQEQFKSVTFDNGPEFLEYEELLKSIFGGKRFDVYYCHSYAAWEKGTNENHNRLMRRFFPKGTDFQKVSQKEIQEAADFLNHYPRKKLGWMSPAELTA